MVAVRGDDAGSGDRLKRDGIIGGGLSMMSMTAVVELTWF